MVVNVLRQLKACNGKSVLMADTNKPGPGGKETFQSSWRSKVGGLAPEATPVFGQQPQVPVDGGGETVL